MLTILGNPVANRGAVTRRHFLTAGGLTAGGLTIGGLSLAELLRAESAAGIRGSHKAVINIHLDGGPPQMDMIDPKPEAPAEIRGEFSPIATRLPGVYFSELLPRLATNLHHWAVIRSLVGSTGQHNAFQCQSGWDEKNLAAFGGRPALGCVVGKLMGSATDVAPSFVDLMQGRPLVRDSARPGFLGPAYKPFRPDISQMFSRPLEEGMKRELSRRGDSHAVSMKLNAALSADRLDDRATLLAGLDRLRHDADRDGAMDAMDQFSRQAAGILLSGRFADAMDFEKESLATIERYIAPPPGGRRFTTAEDHRSMLKLLLARRLVEAGVRCVSISFSDFDTHSDNFNRMRQMLPILDRGLEALMGDLSDRGLLDDVLVVAWGEFGRTPKINDQAGRDHWPRVGMALMGGGGLRGGQVIGATDRTASSATAPPVSYQDILATLYRHFGFDLSHAVLTDPAGRPQRLLDTGVPLAELV